MIRHHRSKSVLELLNRDDCVIHLFFGNWPSAWEHLLPATILAFISASASFVSPRSLIIYVIKYKFYRASWLKYYIYRLAFATCPIRISTMTMYPEDFRVFPQFLHGQMSQTWPRRFLQILFHALFSHQ